MPGEIKPQFSAASSNYYSSDGALQSLNTLRISANIIDGGTLSADLGTNTNIDFSNGANSQTSLAFEGKYKQKFGNNIRAYVRYRHYDKNVNQLRLAAGTSFPINSKLSVYADGHYTTKFKEGKDTFGLWTGTDYKVNKHLSLWGELQKNFSVSEVSVDDWNKGRYSVNIGITYNF